MTIQRLGMPVRALLAGALCLAILGGMIAGHAWPLWTGQVVAMEAVATAPRDVFRGEHVRLDTPATRLVVSSEPAGEPPADGVRVPPTGTWWDSESDLTRAAGAVVYVQLEQAAERPEFEPVSISRRPVAGALNLKGRITLVTAPSTLRVSYGLDAFFMQEGTAKAIEDAVREGSRVQMEVAIASSGRARIRNLVVDGTPVLLPR